MEILQPCAVVYMRRSRHIPLLSGWSMVERNQMLSRHFSLILHRFLFNLRDLVFNTGIEFFSGPVDSSTACESRIFASSERLHVEFQVVTWSQ